MLKVTGQTTVIATPAKPAWNLFVLKNPSNNLEVISGSCREILTAKTAAERVVVGEGGAHHCVRIVKQPGMTVLAGQPGTVYKTIAGESLARVASEQILKGQMVFLTAGGACKVASSLDEDALFLPIRVAAHNAMQGESLVLLSIDNEHVVSEILTVGAPVFLGTNGLVVNEVGAGVVSVALGVATATNRFFGRVGQRVKLNK